MRYSEKAATNEITRPLHLLGLNGEDLKPEVSHSQESLSLRLSEVNRKLKEFGRVPSMLWSSPVDLEKTSSPF